MSIPSLLSPRPHTSTTMMRCTMLSLSRSRLALPTSPSFSTTLPPPSTTSTTAGARPTTSWMDLTRLSSPPRQPSRLPTARTSVSSGRNARLLSLVSILYVISFAFDVGIICSFANYYLFIFSLTERFTYEVKTYETFETVEEVEEIVEETEAVAIIAREQEIVTQDEIIATETTTTTTITTEGETVLEHVQ